MQKAPNQKNVDATMQSIKERLESTGTAAPPGAKTKHPAIFLVPVFGGLILLLIGLFWAFQSWQTLRGFQQTQGTVVANAGRRAQAPLVEYQVDGKTYTTSGSVGSEVFVHSVGETVTVLYEPGRPEEGVVNSFTEMWAIPVVSGGAGVLCMLVFGFVFRKARRQVRA